MDLAFDGSGKLWAVNSSSALYSVNPANGAGTFEVGLSGGVFAEMGLAIGNDGTFYLTEWIGSPRFWTLDPTTGVATPVGPMATFAPHGGDIMRQLAVPAVSEWGIAIMGLLLLVGAKVHFTRCRAV